MEILSSILQFKLVRNPAEELLCLVLIFIMSVVALKTIKAEPSDPSAYEFERGCTIHPSSSWSSTHTMIDKFYRMKDAIIAVLASQSCDDSILNFQSLIGLFLRNS